MMIDCQQHWSLVQSHPLVINHHFIFYVLISSRLTCAWQCVLYAPLHFLICLFEGEHNIDPVEQLQEACAVGAGL